MGNMGNEEESPDNDEQVSLKKGRLALGANPMIALDVARPGDAMLFSPP